MVLGTGLGRAAPLLWLPGREHRDISQLVIPHMGWGVRSLWNEGWLEELSAEASVVGAEACRQGSPRYPSGTLTVSLGEN